METKTIKILDEVENKESVLSFSQSSFKVDRLLSVIRLAFKNEGFVGFLKKASEAGMGAIDTNNHFWFEQGLTCELLEPKKNWRKGKVKIKISLEFEPEEPDEEEVAINSKTTDSESPLDDIRRGM